MKRTISILICLVLMFTMTIVPEIACAGSSYDEVTLEMEFLDGNASNCADLWSGTTTKIKVFKAYWKGNDISKKEYITTINKLAMSVSSGQSDMLTLSKADSKTLGFKVNSSLKADAEYIITYTGSEDLSNNTLYIMLHSSKQREFVNKVKLTSLNASASIKGNTITWKPSITNIAPDYYLIYRSTSKSKGYKIVGSVDGNQKTFLDKDGLKKGTTYYYKVRGEVDFSFGTEYSKYSAVKSIKAKNSFSKITAESINKEMISTYDTGMTEYAYAFGLPDDIHWIENAKTDAEYENNILYLQLIGDYGLNIAFPKDTTQKKLDSLGNKFVEMVYDLGLDTYDALAAFYINEGIQYRIKYKNGFPIIELYSSVDLNLCKEALDFKKVFEEQKQALADAIALKEKLHNNGTIISTMSQYEIMQAYYHALNQYTESDDESTNMMYNVPGNKYSYNCSTIYGFHSIRYCVCAGRAAGFGLSMRLEGIPCYGISVPNHEINVCFIDGKEYYIDAGNQIPAMDIEKCKVQFKSIDENSDVDARKAYKKLM